MRLAAARGIADFEAGARFARRRLVEDPAGPSDAMRDALAFSRDLQLDAAAGLRLAPAARLSWEQRLRLTYVKTNRRDQIRVFDPPPHRIEAPLFPFPETARTHLHYQSSLRLRDSSGGAPLAAFLRAGWENERLSTPAINAATFFAALEVKAAAGPASLSLGGRFEDKERTRSAFTWRATGAWRAALRPGYQLRLHAAYGTGFAAPSLYDLYGFFPDSFRPNPELKPETARGFDLGATLDLFDSQLVFDATFFSSRLRDEITLGSVSPQVSTSINQTGVSRRRGVELSLSARLAPSLRLDGSYTYVRSRDPGGGQEIRRPRHVWQIAADWQITPRLALRTGLSATGSQLDTDFSDFTNPRQVKLKRYRLLDAKLSFEFEPGLALFLRGENLLDEDYQDVFGFQTRRAGVFAGLTGRFFAAPGRP